MSVLLGLMTVMSMLCVRIPKDHTYVTAGRDLKVTEDHVKVNIVFFLLCVSITQQNIAFNHSVFVLRYQGVFSGFG